jgi:hypothetical protein
MNKLSLAARRAELIDRCAEQRTGLAYELKALRPANALAHPLSGHMVGHMVGHIAGYLAGHRKTALGALATVLGLALVRRKRLLALVGSAMPAWRMAQGALAMLAQFRK